MIFLSLRSYEIEFDHRLSHVSYDMIKEISLSCDSLPSRFSLLLRRRHTEILIEIENPSFDMNLCDTTKKE